MVMNRKIGIILLLALFNSFLLCAQNYHVGDIITNLDGSQGVVFWVNHDRTAGWMVAMGDASSACQWGKATTIPDLPSTTSWSQFAFHLLLNELDGKENTRKIREKAQSTSGWPATYAAGVVDYDHDWYLPSAGQMRILFANLPLIEAKLGSNSGFTTLAPNKRYWTSTQNTQSNAWTVYGLDGVLFSAPKTSSFAVRAIRSFEMTGGFASYHWTPDGEITPDILVVPQETTQYTVTITMGNSCSVQDSQLITVSEAEDEELTVTACEFYEWEGDIYYVSGDYSKVLTSPEGCDYTVTLHLTIQNAPSVTLISDDEEICEDESTTLHAVIQQASIGDILCTDGTFVHPADWSASIGKTAKGVIFYVDGTGSHGWAVGLNDLGTAKWCQTATLVPGLTNYSTPREAMYDFEGAYNTQKIRAAGNATQFPAVYKITADMYEEGWYLPAIGQFRYLYANLYTVNNAIQRIKNTTMPSAVLINNMQWFFWSSSQCNRQKKWELGLRGDVSLWDGDKTAHVRAVCSF